MTNLRTQALDIAENVVEHCGMANRNSISLIVEPIHSMLLLGLSPAQAKEIAEDFIEAAQFCGWKEE